MAFEKIETGLLAILAMDSAQGEDSPEWAEFVHRMVTIHPHNWLAQDEAGQRDRLMASHFARDIPFSAEAIRCK